VVSERIQRRIDALLDEADGAFAARDWARLRDLADDVLKLDPENGDAPVYARAAQQGLGEGRPAASVSENAPAAPESASRSASNRAAPLPESFGDGRYSVVRMLGEGGKKRVYLARDNRLQRDVAFALVRTEGLEETGRERVLREAQSMGRIGSHPNLVAIHDITEEDGNPCIVQEYMDGGDLVAVGHRPSAGGEDASRSIGVKRILEIAKDVCAGLSHMHARGFVHRDLKPANVFLSADGTAKVGDFGLVIAGDLSRLTEHGTLIGTVAYMPPEQAVGGMVSAKSDLYSLGAMLYELVTGKPPFTGDDATAIISQHLNTPPVAPSWHTEDCPPALEGLILQMLEKDPEKRPESAAAVAGELGRIDPAAKSTRHSNENPLARLARGVFVGREKELERLRTAFDEAFAGRGGLVMLVGEPGIGKTRTAQEVETYARMRGAQVLWGRSHEGSGAPPYWPWVQVGRQWGSSNDLASIRDEMAPSRGELVRLYPELRTNNPNFIEPEPATDPESAQFRLFDAVALFIRAMQGKGPLVIALDDLHWADKPTLLLLQHVARELSRLRVLILCTYRDTDLSRTHPLSEALAALNRDPGFQRIVLRGLTREEVGAYIRATANVAPKAEVVERIFEETEGNPFFLGEVVNLLTQEGTLLKDSVSEIAVPDGVREALGRRLDRLSEEANDLLQVAAIVGREFAYDMLDLIDPHTEDELLRLVEEGIEARVIEEMAQPGRYRFTHALMQETLLAELSTTRRVRLHGQVGEALEKRWGDRAEERAPRLAEHFVESSTLTPRHARRAVHYAKLAARQAEAQTAWDEAAKWYERALSLVTAAEDGLGEDEAELLAALGHVQRLNTDFRASWRNLMRAIGLFRQRGDGVRGALATLDALENIPELGRAVALTDEALEVLGDADPRLRARLLARRSIAPWEVFDGRALGPEEARRRADGRIAEALELMGDRDWPEVAGYLAQIEATRSLWEGQHEASQEAWERAHVALARAGEVGPASFAAVNVGMQSTIPGDIDRGISAIERALSFAEHHRARYGISNTNVQLAGMHLLRGDIQRYEEAAAGSHLAWIDVTRAKRLADQGLLSEAKAVCPEPNALAAVVRVEAIGESVRIAYLLGESDSARARLSEWFDIWQTTIWGTPSSLAGPAHLGEGLPRVGTVEQVRRVYDYLATHPTQRFTYVGGFALDRLRGDYALHLGLVREAERWYRLGYEICTRERCPVELGRCHQGLAEIEARRDNYRAAFEHLDTAAKLFREHGTKLFLDQVIRRKLELQGVADADPNTSIVTVSHAIQAERPNLAMRPSIWMHRAAALGRPANTDATLMFSDIEGSTALNEQLGDERWMEVLGAHNALIEEHVLAAGGRVVKTIGDGYMVVFGNPRSAVRSALAIQAALEGLDATDGGIPIRVRIGLHAGPAVQHGDDFFGREVNYAARVASAAAGGEVLVSAAMRQRCGGGEWAFAAERRVEFKGFEGVHLVWRLEPREASGEAGSGSAGPALSWAGATPPRPAR
jgi:class 3 adenylate cyclase